MEMLLAVTLLGMLVYFVTQLTNNATTVTLNSSKRLDADGQARLVFDRMGNDFAKMVGRSDADCIFLKTAQNDAFFFYSESPAYYEDSNTARSRKNSVALIGYRITTTNTFYPGFPVLERLGKGLAWDGATSVSAPGSPVFLTYTTGSSVPLWETTLAGNWNKIGTSASGYTDGTDSDYHLLSDQVYRMEIQFLLSDGTLSNNPVINPKNTTSGPPSMTDDLSKGYAPGSRWLDSNAGGFAYICMNATPGAAVWNRLGLKDVSAIVVGLAILDSNSRKIVSSPAQIGDPLADAVEGTPIAKTWMAALSDLTTFAQ
ncbi:MAG: hypothetical protein NTZ46_05845, partial [Verrucomicrobia bacterium]|nr:hypothetical protein [Verrucomicrobiota bacterium]